MAELLTAILVYEPRHGWVGSGGAWHVRVTDEFDWIDDIVDLGLTDPTDRAAAAAEAARRGFTVDA